LPKKYHYIQSNLNNKIASRHLQNEKKWSYICHSGSLTANPKLNNWHYNKKLNVL